MATPTKAGWYFVRVRGELSGKLYTTVVHVYTSGSSSKLNTVFYEGDNFRLDDPRFVEWDTEPLKNPFSMAEGMF